MKNRRDNSSNKIEESKKNLYAEPKFMIAPDAQVLPEPFKNIIKKEDNSKKNISK
jgi:hypothetical protein